MKRIIKLYQKFINRIPKQCNHEKFLHITSGNLALTKCFICGAESIPWRVNPERAKRWRERNPDAFSKIEQAEENAKIYWEQFERNY